jgi:hypothetical protein
MMFRQQEFMAISIYDSPDSSLCYVSQRRPDGRNLQAAKQTQRQPLAAGTGLCTRVLHGWYKGLLCRDCITAMALHHGRHTDPAWDVAQCVTHLKSSPKLPRLPQWHLQTPCTTAVQRRGDSCFDPQAVNTASAGRG